MALFTELVELWFFLPCFGSDYRAGRTLVLFTELVGLWPCLPSWSRFGCLPSWSGFGSVYRAGRAMLCLAVSGNADFVSRSDG